MTARRRLTGPGRCDIYLPLQGPELAVAAASELDGSRSAGRPLLRRAAPDAAWRAAAARGAFLPYRLAEAGGALVVRVVLGPLDEAEEAEWVGRAAGALELRDGLTLAPIEAVRGAADEESSARVGVPQGRYRVTLLAQLPGPEGLACLAAAGGEAERSAGPYWRRTRLGEEAPDWLALALGQAPHHDPERELEWEDFQETDRFGELLDAAEPLGLGFVDLLVHLEPDPQAPETTLPEDGWLRATDDPRRPEQCPRGLKGEPFG